MIIYIEGNIGTGKTTFLDMLEKRGHYVVREPVDLWKEKGLLGKFYSDMERWSYTFQSYAFMTRLHNMKHIYELRNKVVFVERSNTTDKNVFAKNLHKEGKMTDMEWDIYNSWFNWTEKVYIKAGYPIKPTAYIYLHASPSVSFERIKKRARGEEDNIPIEYLRNIHTLHERWLKYPQEPRTNVRVLIVDCDRDFELDKLRQKEIIFDIQKFIKKL